MSTYEERRQARIERYRERAANARTRSAAAFAGVDRILQHIPPGQPILVGHHSERRHRADIKRMDNGMRRGVEEQKKATYFDDRADSAESNRSVSGQDPEAITKLRKNLEEREERQARMVAANKALKKNDDVKLAELGFSPHEITELKTPDFCNRTGFADYQLKNNNAEIRRLKKRIEALGVVQARPEQTLEVGTTTVRENADFASTELLFAGKPAQAIIDELKLHGWRWLPSVKIWSRKRRDNYTWAFAVSIAEKAAAAA